MDRALCDDTDHFSLAARVRCALRVNMDSSSGWYWLLLTFIGVVSAYDAYLTYAFRGEMLEMEENPVGLMLIRLEPDSLSYFFLVKTVGTCLVLSLLAAAECAGGGGLNLTRSLFRSLHQTMPNASQTIRRIDHTFRSYRQAILTSVASFQAWLLWYLTM